VSYWVCAERPGDGDGDDDGACLLRWMLACSLASLVCLLACLLARPLASLYRPTGGPCAAAAGTHAAMSRGRRGHLWYGSDAVP